MTPLSVVLLFVTILGLARSEKILLGHLINDYFDQKYISQVTVFTCWNTFGRFPSLQTRLNYSL